MDAANKQKTYFIESDHSLYLNQFRLKMLIRWSISKFFFFFFLHVQYDLSQVAVFTGGCNPDINKSACVCLDDLFLFYVVLLSVVLRCRELRLHVGPKSGHQDRRKV